MLKSGDRIQLENGKEVEIETLWGSGKHTVFKLKGSGEQVLDLHKAVESGKAKLLGSSKSLLGSSEPNTKRPWWSSDPLPKDNEDFEE